MKHIHLIGIGGTGLSAIARVLLERGYTVSGSDSKASPLFKAITAAGAKTFLGHAAPQIAGADLVIRSSAIPDDNPEVIAAHEQNIPVLKRAEFLQELTAGKDTLAIAGSHGKTTTTAMLIWALEALGTEPSFIAGGIVKQLECNARAGTGLYFAIEADEYDSMFLGLSPKVAVITNIEHDHPDCFPTEDVYLSAFEQFIKRVRPDGLALVCHDDPQARRLAAQLHSAPFQVKTYGTDPEANYQAQEISVINGSPTFKFVYHDASEGTKTLGRTHLSLPGVHNVLNATAVLGIIHHLGLDTGIAMAALAAFTGAGRRFEVLGHAGDITLIDDYGHHPTEISATLAAARSRYPDRRIWAIWQPHTYSRTRTLEGTFIEALKMADRVAVLPIFAAREENAGYSSEIIVEKLPGGKATFLEDFSTAKTYLTDNLQPGDVAILFSAGDALEISRDVLTRLQKNLEDRKENLQHG